MKYTELTAAQLNKVREAVALAISQADTARIPENYGFEIDHDDLSDWAVYLADAAIAAYRGALQQASGESQ